MRIPLAALCTVLLLAASSRAVTAASPSPKSASKREAAKSAYTFALRLAASCHLAAAAKKFAEAAKLDPDMSDGGVALEAARLRCRDLKASHVPTDLEEPLRRSAPCAEGGGSAAKYKLTDGRTVSVPDGVYSDGTVDPDSARWLAGVSSGCGGSGRPPRSAGPKLRQPATPS